MLISRLTIAGQSSLLLFFSNFLFVIFSSNNLLKTTRKHVNIVLINEKNEKIIKASTQLHTAINTHFV